jgi:hypothetical protein
LIHRPLINLVHQTLLIDEYRAFGGMRISRVNLPQCHYIHHRSYITRPGIEFGRRNGKPASNRLSYGTAFTVNFVQFCVCCSPIVLAVGRENPFVSYFSEIIHNLISRQLFLIQDSTATINSYFRLIVVNFWKTQSKQVMRYSGLVNVV